MFQWLLSSTFSILGPSSSVDALIARKGTTHSSQMWTATIFKVWLTMNLQSNWLNLGLEIVGFCPGRQNICLKTKLECFRTHFGVSPETLQAIFIDMQTTKITTACIPKPDAFYFLMAFHWLKIYPTEAQCAATFKCDEKTIHGKVWKYVRAIQALKGQKVRTKQTLQR